MTQDASTRSPERPHDAWPHVLRGAGGTYSLRMLSSATNIVTGLLLARWLGAGEFGAFMYAVAWASILLVPSKLGADSLLVRTVAAAHRHGAWGHLRGAVRWMSGAVLTAGGVVSILTAAVFLALGARVDRDLTRALYWALPLVPMMAFALVMRATMEGLRRVVRAQFHELVLQPVLFLLLVLGIRAGAPSRLDANLAVALTDLTLVAVVIVAFVRMRRTLPAEARAAVPVYEPRRWLAASSRLVLLSSAIVLNMRLDVVMLGLLSGKSAAGVYAIASMAVGLLALLPLAANTALGPHVARLHAAGETASVQRLLTRLSRLVLLLVLAGSTVLIILAPWALGLVGPEYPRAAGPLAILCAAQLVNAASGPVSLVLVMTGHEQDAALGFSIGAGANAVLNLLLIPPFGLEGAACATLASNCIWNFLLVRRIRSRVGLDPSVAGRGASQ